MEQTTIFFLVGLVILVIILFFSLINLKIQIKKVTDKLKIILHSETKEIVTVSLDDKNLEDLAETINGIVEKYCNNLVDIKKREDIFKENIASLSHDLRTPLTSIRGYLQLLESASEDKKAEYINALHKKAFRLERLIDDFYQISLLDNENYIFEYEIININELLTEILLENYSLFVEKDISPQIDMPKQSIYIYSDKTACVRIIQNILFNAIDATSGGVHILLEEDEEKICLTVKNPVNNFKTSEIDRIFERFYMEDRARGYGHSGQGLHIVKKLLLEMKCDPPQANIKGNCFSILVKWKMVGDKMGK